MHSLSERFNRASSIIDRSRTSSFKSSEQRSLATSRDTNAGIGHGETELHGLFELWPLRRTDSHKEIETHLEHIYSIVAVHGLNGDPYRTWTENGKLWLQDLLPTDVPQARVFTFGYNSGIAFTGSASMVEDYARALIERLRARRRDFQDAVRRPIIFICHSLGGIVVKRALVLAHERIERYASISNDTFGVIFLGTPHEGSDAAFWGHCFGSLADVLTLGSIRTGLLHDLKPKSEFLEEICAQFAKRSSSLRIFSIYERLKMKGLSKLIVDRSSALLNLPNEVAIPIEADHRSMCWFSDPQSEKYRLIIDCVRELVEDSLQIQQPQESTIRVDFLRCLESPDPEACLRRMPRPVTGTCEWALQTEEFDLWRTETWPKVLWLWGPPGIGKTTILRHIVEHLRKSFQREETQSSTDSHVIFSFPLSTRDNSYREEDILRSHLSQVLSQSETGFRYLKEEQLEQYVYGMTSEPVQLLWSMLSTVVHRCKQSMFWFIVDIMDEMEDLTITSFLDQVGRLLDDDFGNKVKFLISSRMKYSGKDLQEHLISMPLQGRNAMSDDIRRFVSAKVGDICTEGQIPWRYQTQIEDSLINASENNFLQVNLAWKTFSSGIAYWSPQVIKKRLDTLNQVSKEAEDYYCSLLARIPEDYRYTAKAGFTWIIGARKLLTVSELQHAVAISSGQTSWSDLVDALGFNFEVQFDLAFGYLLQIDHDKQVRFIHQTVKDVLTAKPKDVDCEKHKILSRFHIASSDIDAELAKACLVVLSFRDFVRLRDIAREAFSQQIQSTLVRLKHPNLDPSRFNFEKYDGDDKVKLGEENHVLFDEMSIRELKRTLSSASLEESGHTLLSYCVAFWNHHCVQGGSDNDVVQSLTQFVFLKQSHFFHLVAMLLGVARIHDKPFWSSVDQFAQVPPLHFLMRIGDHPSVMQNLLIKGQRINERDCNGFNALVWAVLEERQESLELILSRNDVSINDQINGQDNALHICCRANVDPSYLQRLLDDPRTDINAPGRDGETVLHLLMEQPRTEPLALTLLDRKDLDINVVNRQGLGYLDNAFQDGRSESIVEAIIARHDVPMNWFEKTPRRRQKDISEESEKRTYLEIAGYLGWYRIEDAILETQLLQALRTGASNRNMLENYAFYGLERRLTSILDTLPGDFCINETSFDGRTLLFLCAQQDWPSIILRLKSEFSISDLVQDEEGRTLVHWASELHWDQIQELVVGKTPLWLDTKDDHGRSPIHVAAESRNEKGCRVLLKAGADWLSRDKNGRLPAHIAAEHGHRNVLLCLLEHPINPVDQDAQKRQLLHYLVMWHSETFLRRCLKILQPKLDVFDRRRRTPLHYAAIYGNSGAVKALLSNKASSSFRDASGFTALHYALIDGSLESVQALLDANADLNALDKFGRNSLQLAVRSENMNLVDFVVKRLSKDTSHLREAALHRDVYGRTVLHVISAWGTRQRNMDDEDDDEEAFLLELELDDFVINRRNVINNAAVKKYVGLLLALGAEPNAQDNEGRTPLHTAIYNTSLIAVEIFLSVADIELDLEDKEGCSPLDRAVNDSHNKIADCLRASNAQHTENWRSKIKPLYAPWQDDDETEQMNQEGALVPTKSEVSK